MRVFPQSGSYANAAELYAGIMQAALVSPDDDGPCTLPDWVSVPADHPHIFCTVRTVTTWNGGSRQWDSALAEDCAASSECMAEVHGPQRHCGAHKVRFRFSAQGAQSSMTVAGTRGRLLALADTVRKQWALFGGGQKPAELVKPRAERRATWPMTIVRVWLQQMEDGADHAGAVLTGERIDARFYPGSTSKGGYVLAAPIQVEGLPDGMVSAVRNDGEWVVADHASGLKLGNGNRSRKGAEAEALKIWSDAPDEKRSRALQQARATSVDHDAARQSWCVAHGIEVDDPADLQATEPMPEPIAEPAPVATPEIVAAEPAVCTPALAVGGKADHPPSLELLRHANRIATGAAGEVAHLPPAERAAALRRTAKRIDESAAMVDDGTTDVAAMFRLAADMLRDLADTIPLPVVEMRNEAPAADDPAPDVASAFTMAAEQLRDLANATGARQAARPIMARRWAFGGIRRQRRALPASWRGADALRRPAARCGMAQAPPPAWGKCAPTANRNEWRAS